MNEITQDQVRELFDYKDGELHWKVSGSGREIDRTTGHIGQNGYRRIRINYKQYLAHRLTFLYHHGYLPDSLDHIDGDKLNNDITNLREATNQQNQGNSKKIKFYKGVPTSSIYKGVMWNRRERRWIASIWINKKYKYLGRFVLETKAALAYNKAAIAARGEFARINDINLGDE